MQSIVGIDVSQLYHFSMCQARQTALCRNLELDSESGEFKPRQNKKKSFENMVMSYFHRVRPQCRLDRFCTTGAQKENDANSVDGFYCV